MKLQDYPESVRLLIEKLPEREQNLLLHPHVDLVKSVQIQETIIQIIEESINDGDSEESMLTRLTEYANTKWP